MVKIDSYILGKTSQIDRSEFRLRAHLFLTTLNVMGLGLQLTCLGHLPFSINYFLLLLSLRTTIYSGFLQAM